MFGAYWVTKTTACAGATAKCESPQRRTRSWSEREIRVAPAIRASIPDWLNALGKQELGDGVAGAAARVEPSC